MRSASDVPGGAANVAANIASLGGRALVVGLYADDEAGRELERLLRTRGVAPDHLVRTATRATTTKLRIIAHQQHVLRVDDEATAPADAQEASRLMSRVEALLPDVAAVIISDYAKGVLGPRVLPALIARARTRGVPILVDPKGIDYGRYGGATLLAPNRLEALTAAGVAPDVPDAVAVAGRELLARVDIDGLVITEGEAGMSLFRRGQAPTRLRARARIVYDVTGAGDSVMAVLGLTLAAGADLIAAGQLANLAGGLAVEQVGTAAVSVDQLRAAVKAEPS
jgi:D-beta-D-heptose 7-phosphate kinase/D-beta-D-heptose 1-phosphate adenosyltransferase